MNNIYLSLYYPTCEQNDDKYYKHTKSKNRNNPVKRQRTTESNSNATVTGKIEITKINILKSLVEKRGATCTNRWRVSRDRSDKKKPNGKARNKECA